ncbi:MAG: FtsX-like permease family protein, partial [Bacteroidota bacterium]
KVTGVLKNIPENSHLQFDLLISITTRTSEDPELNTQFGSNYLITYLVFNPSTEIKAFEAKMPEFLTRYMPPDGPNDADVNNFYKLFFQSLSDVHLSSMDIEHDYHNYRKFNGTYLQVFSIVGLFILLIASFNFMNLITARASHRWKEIGVRKSIGALKSQLFTQFAVESVFLAVLAFLLATSIDSIMTPLLNTWIGRSLSFSYFYQHPSLLIGAFVLTAGLGFLAGIYPSYFLASYNPISVLKGGNVKNNKSIFRSALVVIQFGLAMAMIVSTLVVLQQFWFMQNKDIGFNKSQMLLVGMNNEANNKFLTLKEELKKNSHILGVTASGQRLGNNFHQWGFKLRTDSIRGMTPSNVNVDFDFLDVYEIKVKEGRGFSKEYATDKDYAFVINESFAKEMALDQPVGVSAGHAWYPDDTLGTIIGVVEDFNFNSLHYEINTLAMVVHPEWGYDELSIKVNADNIPEAIAHVEKVWNTLVPSWPFDYSFLDEHFAELYNSDRQMKSVITIMALLAIFIACMGLFGLAAITTERKIKEIGIRKIL